ncbi:MAG: prefoldin subunit beta, partial [Candidatus Aenigmarchaeota archaeon]|nr:prefoldin subunit beta [Candidatus Aenigmarchaeota archaeon]
MANVPPEMGDMVKRFQQLQQQLQVLMFQKQNIQVQQAEVENALKEITGSKDKELYEIIGTVMIKRTRSELKKSLKGKNEIMELRLSTLDKQINSITEQVRKVQNSLMEMSKPRG